MWRGLPHERLALATQERHPEGERFTAHLRAEALTTKKRVYLNSST